MTTLTLSTLRRGARDVAREHRVEVLTATATVALFAFYYVARADLVGSRGADGTWLAVSAPAREPFLHFLFSALLLGAAPVAVGHWICGLRLRDLGLGLGDVRRGLLWLAIGIPVAMLAGWMGASSPTMQAVYPLDPAVTATPASFIPHAMRNLMYFGAWEVLFRGVLLFGLRGAVGAGGANAGQTSFSVLAHFGRPMTETFSAIPAGFAFGGIALHTRSVWYVAIIHWTVGMSMDWFILAGG